MTSRLLARATDRAAKLLAQTWQLEVSGEQHVRRLRSQGVPLIYAVWHCQLLAPLWHRRDEGITLLISTHDDAAHLAAAAYRWGYRVVLGSSTRGGAGGLRRVVRALRSGGEVGVTPDGPLGPARVAKGGAVTAARLTAAAIVPVGCAASAAWRVGSWDGFLVPQPFAQVRIVYGAPFTVARDRGALDRSREQLDERLHAVEAEAECG